MLDELWKIKWDAVTSWYEFAAHCYDCLMEPIDYDDQTNFLSCYIFEGDNEQANNPNLRKLHHLSAQVFDLIENHGSIVATVGEIHKLCNELVLQPFYDPLYNSLTPLFFLIKASDEYYKKHNELLFDIPKINIQDKQVTTKSLENYVFKKQVDNIFFDNLSDRAAYQPLIKDNISGQFESLLFVDKKNLPNNCNINIANIMPDKRKRPNVWNDNENLRVGIIPYTKEHITNFQQTNGATMRVIYHDQYDDVNTKRLISLLDLSIKEGCNIVVFPEYVVSPELQKRIAHHLKKKYMENCGNANNLMLVIAGTGWRDNNSNVSQLFDYKGELLGEYYKFSPYFPASEPIRSIEGIQHRGEFCTLVDLPGIGRILPSICRDAVNGEYSQKMVALFRPFAMFILAWSPSIMKGFKIPMKVLASQYLVSSFLCNCCEALYFKETQNMTKNNFESPAVSLSEISSQNSHDRCGLAVFPALNQINHDIDADVRELLREKENCSICMKTGCVYILSLSYSEKQIKDKEIMSLRKVYFT